MGHSELAEGTSVADEINVNERMQVLALWSGPVMFFFFFLSILVMMKFVPPLPPIFSGDQVMDKVADNIVITRLGIALGMSVTILWVPFSAVISIQMARIEGFRAPVLSLAHFGVAIMTCYTFMLPFMSYAPAFYRTERSPEVIQLATDSAWLALIMPWSPGALQAVLIAMAGLIYKNGNKIFPRWYCYYCLWAAFCAVPGAFAGSFISGPFAWNGILSFWLVILFFPPAFIMIVPILLKAIKHHKLDYA